MMIETEQIEKRIAELTAERDQLVQEGNARIAYLNGQLAALTALIAPPPNGQSDDAQPEH